MLGVGAVAVAAAACVAWALWGRGRPAAESHAPPPPIDETRLPVVPFRLPPVRKLPEAPVDAADDARRQAVETAFHQSWDAYRRHAWGRDEFHPLSKTGSNLLANDTAPLGYTIVDTLDSLILLGWRDAYEEARDWVRDELHWHIDGRLNVFETTIRMLGGLLSASALMLDPPPGTLARSPADAAMFLAKAERLAERLAPAFDTPSGIPKREINLATGASFYDTDNRNASSLAEFTTVQLELKYLAHRTRNETYWRMSERPMGVVRASTAPPHPGILPLFADPKSGHFYAGEIRLGSRADSYYEYLVKQYLLTNRTEPVYRDMYEQAFDGIKSYLLGHVTAANDTFVHTVEMVPRRASNAAGFAWARRNKQDHLVCFLGGTMMLAASSLRPGPPAPPTTASGVPAAFREDWRVGHELTKACVNTYTASATGLGAEIVFFHAPEEQALQPEGRAWRVKRGGAGGAIIDSRNILRPETVESLYIAFQLTGDPIYREWGWYIFQSFQRHGQVDGGRGGYAGIDDIDDPNTRQIDRMETFWLSETLKYLYLLFAPRNVLPLHKWVFNTEAHPLPVFEPQWATGIV